MRNSNLYNGVISSLTANKRHRSLMAPICGWRQGDKGEKIEWGVESNIDEAQRVGRTEWKGITRNGEEL